MKTSGVAVDSMILSWWMGASSRGKLDPVNHESRRRALVLLDQLHGENATIVIPTIVVAEVLLPMEARQQGNFLAALSSTSFFVAAFDIRAAAIAAKLWQFRASAKAEEKSARSIIKTDILIIATAAAAGAQTFYSHDEKCRKLAIEGAKLKALPLPSGTLPFPDDDEDE